MNIARYINIPMLYVTIMTQNQNDSINSILHYDRVAGKDCCLVFPAPGFLYLTLYPRQCKRKVAPTYLGLRTMLK